MSSSARSNASAIPVPRRLGVVEDRFADLMVSPGGTYFSTTPGGTRIVYDRSALMNLRQSPYSSTPPSDLPSIPGVTTSESKKKKTPCVASPATAHTVHVSSPLAEKNVDPSNASPRVAVTSTATTTTTAAAPAAAVVDQAEDGATMFAME